ncbi:MAG: hypothetical protein DYG88_15290 [Chloroflexi bacterium CFX4]|nr:hypothetical protein [Chloroflexi bacterium CFX4]MDL1922130.1 hypothetical protein [Chloroflexi bacterium CFX3]
MITLPDALWRAALGELARHLPPSGGTLHLLYIGLPAQAADIAALRADLTIHHHDPHTHTALRFAADQFDAVLVRGDQISRHAEVLGAALPALRLGGRLILLDAAADAPDQPESLKAWQGSAARQVRLAEMVQVLEQAGFVRVLTERLLDGFAVLSRGERDYTHLSTAERIQHAAERDSTPDQALIALTAAEVAAAVRGNFLFVLVRQAARRPAWETPTAAQHWRALTLAEGDQVCLPVFSALPKAVAFMQAAVKANTFIGVNKIAKFPKHAVQAWQTNLLLNPRFGDLHEVGRFQAEGAPLILDPHTAITGEE